MVRLIRKSAEPLHHQLYRQIRDELIAGNFSNNSSRLPSTRALAADLGISRLTVNLAFDKLHAEGYLRSKIGSGTFVADPLPETFLSARRSKIERLPEPPPRLSNRVRDLPDKRSGKEFDFGIAGPPGVTFVPASRHSMSFPWKYGNVCGHRFLLEKEHTCSNTLRATATPICARPSQHIFAIFGARAVSPIKSSLPLERSRR
jgi:Transcriptional regulators